MSKTSNRELWIAGNLFKHVDGLGLGLCALGDLLKAADYEKVEECSLTNIGFLIYEIGSSLSQVTESAKKHCGMPDCQN